MNRNLRDIAVRFVKTALFTAGGVLLGVAVGVPVTLQVLLAAVVIGVVGGVVAAGQNLLGVVPESIPARAAQTFVQAFGAFIIVSGYALTGGLIVAAFSAAISATVNFIKSAS